MRSSLSIIALALVSSPVLAQAVDSTEFYVLSEGSNDDVASRVLGRMFPERMAAPGEGVDFCKEAFEVQMNPTTGKAAHESLRPRSRVLLEQLSTSSTALGEAGVNASVGGLVVNKQFLDFDATAQMDVAVDEIMLRDCCRRTLCPAYYVRSIFKVGKGSVAQQRKRAFEARTGDVPVSMEAARAAGFTAETTLDGTWSVALLSRVPPGIAVRNPCRLKPDLASINDVEEKYVRVAQTLNVPLQQWSETEKQHQDRLQWDGFPAVQTCVSFKNPETKLDESFRFDSSVIPVMPAGTEGNIQVFGVKPGACDPGPAWAASMVGSGLGFATAAVTGGIAGWAGYTLQDTTAIADGGPSADLKQTADGLFYPMVAGAAVGALAGGVGLFAASQFDECRDQ